MKKFNYLSADKQAELLPNHTGINYHNARFNKYSENRNYMIDISCFHNPKGTFYYLKSEQEKSNPYTNSSAVQFTNKQKALKFIEAVNGKLTDLDKNFHPRKYVKCPIDNVWIVQFYNESKPQPLGS